MKPVKIIFSSLLFLTMFSCKKLIEIEETDFVGGDIALATISNNEQGVIGAYAGLAIEMDILMNATFSDEVRVGEFYNAATTHEWQYSSNDIGLRDNFTAFTPLYRTIDRVNRVLQALPGADSLKTTDTEALRMRVRGEALFMRAFCHFQLFRYYAGNYDPAGLALAYVEVPSLEPKERIAMGPYFQKLNADLAEAKSLLPNNLADVFRATRLAASGFQARVALYMRDWTNAITYSTEYINSIPLAPQLSFNGIWTDANNLESAFKLRRTTAAGGRIGSLFRGISANATKDIGTVTWTPSDKLWNSYDKVNDVRFSSYLKSEPILSNQNPPRNPRIIQKYAGTGYASPAENIADAKVFRTGEMYLIRAEAKAETGDLVGAAADVNALRAARITGYTNVTFTSKEAAIAAIIQERFVELPFEGHRFWDLKRRNLPVERLAIDAPSPVGTTLPAGNFRFLLPIPNTEILANSLIKQNPGYTN
jgi:hypothetical protein